MISYTHDMNLVLASVVVSIIASTTGLAMMNNLRKLTESKRKAVIVMSAFVLGGGIWSMHFLAMLALNFNVPIHYDLLQTLSSGLIAILVVGFALLLLHFYPRTNTNLNIAGVSLGLGIVAMHFVGMLGMRGVIPEFGKLGIGTALLVALVTGIAAVRVSYGSRSKQNILRGGFMFGLSVVLVHHSAMMATTFSVDPSYSQQTIALDQGTLAIAVTLSAFLIGGSFLLAASTFVSSSVDDINKTEDQDHMTQAAQTTGKASAVPTPASANSQREIERQSEQSDAYEDQSQTSKSYEADIVDAPGHTVPAEPEPDTTVPASAIAAPATNPPVLKIPYEEHKQVMFVPSDAVAAIRADGRYTQLYTRAGVKFCPWSITDAEKRLRDVRFYRSHRSYLINLESVNGFKKNRDAGVCIFEGYAQLNAVPVSRTRVADVLRELGL